MLGGVGGTAEVVARQRRQAVRPAIVQATATVFSVRCGRSSGTVASLDFLPERMRAYPVTCRVTRTSASSRSASPQGTRARSAIRSTSVMSRACVL